MTEDQMQAVASLRSQIDWRGPKGKAMGHIVLQRKIAEILLASLQQSAELPDKQRVSGLVSITCHTATKVKKTLQELVQEVLLDDQFWQELEASAMQELERASCYISFYQKDGGGVLVGIGGGDLVHRYKIKDVALDIEYDLTGLIRSDVHCEEAEQQIENIAKFIARLEDGKAKVAEVVEAYRAGKRHDGLIWDEATEVIKPT